MNMENKYIYTATMRNVSAITDGSLQSDVKLV
jgi:hypothetical protein